MPLLTKKFTRDSLKRANVGSAGIPNGIDDQAKAKMIQREMAYARAKSMRSRNVLNQQHRRHRSLSRGASSPHRSFGTENAKNKPDLEGPKPTTKLSHPNDEYTQAFHEAELLTQMSSLTEPTWAPSVVGGSDIISAPHRHNHQNQRSRTANYNSIRHHTRFQQNTRAHRSRATITISTAKDQKETKVLLLDNGEKEKTTVGHNKSISNQRHHERATVGTEGIEVYRTERDESREDGGNDQTDGSDVKRLSKSTENSGMRDDVPKENELLTTRKATRSLSSRRSKARGADDESKASRTRGRSGRPSGNRKSKRRSSSISSRRSSQSVRTASTTPTLSKHSSTSSSRSISLTSRKSKSGTPTMSRGKEKSSEVLRSSSVPPATSNSKRSQRTSSVPPNIFKMREMDRYNRYGSDPRGHKQQRSMINAVSDKNLMDASLETVSTMADLTFASSQSNARSKVSFATVSQTSSKSAADPLLAPSSNIEAARASLRPRLRRSNSNRSLSSAQSETVASNTSNSYEKSKISASAAPMSSSNTVYASRMHKLAQDVHAKKIQRQRQLRRHELETKQHRQQEKLRSRVHVSAIEADGVEPHPTTATTLLFDFLIFHLLLLITLPQRAVLSLWSRMLSKKWTASRKNVLVTCANSALGSETARQFAMQGANLILVSHTTKSIENGLNWLVDECQELGAGKIRCYSADLSNAVGTELTLRQAAKDFNDTFDIVVLNGETKAHGCLFEEILDVHQIENMLTENTLGCIMTLHYSLKHIPKSSDSRIVILSSTSGVIASPYRSVSVATQHALKGFCDSIRMELNDTYSERRAPKICFASFPELVGQNIQNRDSIDLRISRMGANIAPMKTHSWAGIPLQQAVHDLLGAITSGERDFGAPRYVSAWTFMQILAPRFVDFSIFRHFRKTLYRPVECGKDVSTSKKGGKSDGASVSNKTWS